MNCKIPVICQDCAFLSIKKLSKENYPFAICLQPGSIAEFGDKFIAVAVDNRSFNECLDKEQSDDRTNTGTD